MPNGNDRGSSKDRHRRKLWLLETYRADVDMLVFTDLATGQVVRTMRWIPYFDLFHPKGSLAVRRPTCRCYRCGKLLWYETLTIDRIIPGARGGTYRRNNIRPACLGCNSSTGATVRRTSTTRRSDGKNGAHAQGHRELGV